ncbi:TIGR03111 family XrtG-associated glycosyltransferase [Limosilactobacillus portuensis]|uniref:Glycosyltransferase, exosortase G system-associated n=1 Tax=Limosilactobacillus portuensis TaxID=2742601 RepID=A0ABS6IW91_9LACO|nr:TIGR03111 family XrtG-associated glycosyltransferase [Limosilactobacillus portuensis]MBU9695796.1 putative glycosyltransferase, exosortase G system-associated [Limosilactobacillus portuensis]MDU1506223.1 putative glycosyltransferase, exosortase G system-associated [Limosilactobacillus vaginalis]PMC26973.1 putative glycosyltransferase, exosortase G system-associated [Gardnerella vaginalis]WCT59947.1 putative glycosyltransferase, exosortase G system-associated [Limosilactobacillus portuensis]
MFLSGIIVELGFWISWLLLPLIYEFLPALYGFITLGIAGRKLGKLKRLNCLPRISLIIPVYNSENTIYNCIRSVADSTYPDHLVSIIVANNQSIDRSFSEYRRAHFEFQQLFMQWIDTTKGKARALNSAIYRSNGEYIIHIDSDGQLQKDALMNIVRAFENDPELDAQTGTILTQKDSIKKTRSPLLKFLRENEYFEYAQSFLAGRAIESQENHLFTMSGAFSAFRREKLLQTKLYNIQTVGEDIDMTFQIRYQLKGKVALCPEAIFYVEPLDNLGKLYTQRQRWQRGELEAIHYYMNKKQLSLKNIFKNFIVRRLIMDHTILFLRIIWMAAFLVLIPFGYSLKLILISFVILYLLYVFICLLNFIDIQYYLRFFPEERHYYVSKFYILVTLPLYYMLCSTIQFIGIINSMTEPAAWKVESFSAEMKEIKKMFRKDLRRIFRIKWKTKHTD